MISLEQARKILYLDIVGASDPYDPIVLPSINQVLERFYTMGKWTGSNVEVALTGYDGQVTLPRQCESMLWFRNHQFPRVIRSRWFEWMQWGIGYRDKDCNNTYESLDQGTGYCTFRDSQSATQYRIKALASEDATISVTLQGTDTNNRRIYTTDPDATAPINGETVTLVAGTADTTQTFQTFTGFVKDVTRGYVEVWTINSDGSDGIMVGQYEPGETVPDYHRYKVGKLNGHEDFHALCKLQYMPLSSEEDLVIPGNIGALKNGLIALYLEGHTEPDSGDKYWAKAFLILNSDLAQERGGAFAPMTMYPAGVHQRKVLNLY